MLEHSIIKKYYRIENIKHEIKHLSGSGMCRQKEQTFEKMHVYCILYLLYVDAVGIEYGQDGRLYMCGGQLSSKQGDLCTVGAAHLSANTHQQPMRRKHTNT